MENLQQECKNIKVSVIMPIYNAGEYLTRAISDVLGQSLTDIELICVDDGSTDNSPKIINRFKAKDGRVIYHRQSNAGPSVARNKGLELACGKYVIFLDADDFYEKDLLRLLYDACEADNLDIAVTRFDIYDEGTNRYSKPVEEPKSAAIFDNGAVTSKNEYPQHILTGTTGYAWNKMFLKSFLMEKRLAFDPDLYVFEDVHFVCSAMALAERVKRIEGINIHHRVYSEQSRSILFRKYYGQVPEVYKKLREYLMQQGMYIPLKNGYLNLSAGRCYKIYNILWADGKERMWNLLHTEYLEALDWLNHNRSDFESREVYEFVANVALYTYEDYHYREENGRNIIDVDQLDKEKLNRKVKVRHKGELRRAAWRKLMSIINIFKKK